MTNAKQKETIRYRKFQKLGLPPEADASIPDAFYQCENVQAGLLSGNNHYYSGGYFPSTDLFHSRFEVVEYQSIFGGFWCQNCLEQFGVKTKGISLQKALQRNLIARLTNALKA